MPRIVLARETDWDGWRAATRAHVLAGGDVLWARGLGAGSLLAGPDWRTPAPARVPLSAQLAAVSVSEESPLTPPSSTM